jgi:hypothetical protein
MVDVTPDYNTNSVKFTMKYSGHVQVFTIKFPRNSPFYKSAGTSVGLITDSAYCPPPGHSIPLYVPVEKVAAPAPGVVVHVPSLPQHDWSNTTLLDHEMLPYRLRGLQPLGASAKLALQSSTIKPIPAGGYHLRAYAKRNVAVEDWDRSDSKVGAYTLDNMVGDIPYPASYKSHKLVINALMQSINHAIAGDPDNSQHGLTAEDLISVAYNVATRCYTFECGPKGARIELTMERHLALMFGFDYPDEHTTIRFAPVPSRATGMDVSNEDKAWSRIGHVMISLPNKGLEGNLPVAVESTYPVTPSLGTETMQIHTNIISDAATIIDGVRSNWPSSLSAGTRTGPSTVCTYPSRSL